MDMIHSSLAEAAPGSPTDTTPLGLLIIRTSHRLRREYVRALKSIGMTLRDYSVLLALRVSGPASQRTLARRAAVDPSELVACLDGLSRTGLIHRSRDPIDRRRQIVTMTWDGLEQLDRADTHLTAVNTKIFGNGRAAVELHRALIAVTGHDDENR